MTAPGAVTALTSQGIETLLLHAHNLNVGCSEEPQQSWARFWLCKGREAAAGHPQGCEEAELLLRPCANHCSESVPWGAGCCPGVIVVQY